MLSFNIPKTWPMLSGLRRSIMPIIEQIDESTLAVEPIEKKEFAFVVKIPVDKFSRQLHNSENVYANNLASLKYIETDDGKVYERRSYAYRPNGRFGTWQLHYRLFEHEKGTAIFVHWELSPWTDPINHRNGVRWSATVGKAKAYNHVTKELGISKEKIIEPANANWKNVIKKETMKHSKKKKSLLTVALGLAPTAITLLTKERYVEGAILMVIAAGMIVLYDHYDDKAKQAPQVPGEVDKGTFKQIAKMGANVVEYAKEEITSKDNSQ